MTNFRRRDGTRRHTHRTLYRISIDYISRLCKLIATGRIRGDLIVCVMDPLLITESKRPISMLMFCMYLVGLILAYGIIVLIGGTNDLAGAAFGVDTAPDIGGSDGVFPPIVWLLAQLTVTIFGAVSVFLGFQVCM